MTRQQQRDACGDCRKVIMVTRFASHQERCAARGCFGKKRRA